MKNFIFILTFFLFQSVQAFQYIYTGPHQSKFVLGIYQITKKFEEIGFEKEMQFNDGDHPIYYADQVLNSKNGEGKIFIKKGLIAPIEFQHKIIKLSNYYLYHEDDLAIAFFDFNETEVNLVIKKIKANEAGFSFKKIKFHLIQSVYAEEMACRNRSRAAIDNLSEVGQSLSAFEYTKEFSSCAAVALKEDLAHKLDVKNFFEKFSLNPIGLWDGVKKQYEAFKNLGAMFSKEFFSMTQNLNLKLTPEESLSLTCAIGKQIGPILPKLLIGAGAGLAIAKIMTSILPKVLNMAKLMAKLQSLKLSKDIALQGLACEI